MSWISRDALHAFRGLRRNLIFTSIAVASLGLGIGANTAIFSLVNTVLLKRLPVSEPRQLVTFGQTYRGERSGVVYSLRAIDQLATHDSLFDGVFGWLTRPITLSGADRSQWVNGALVTGQYFRTLRVGPAVGRLLNETDVRDAKANPVCILSYGLWQREFGGDPRILGRNIFLNGHAYRVLGVTPRGFYGADLQQVIDVTVPATRIADFIPGIPNDSGISWLIPMARLKAGMTKTGAQQRLQLLSSQLDPGKRMQLRLDDGSQGFNTTRSEFGRPLLVLMGIVALVLLAACANLANLQLARSQERTREFAIRLSLGASRGRITGQLFVENLLLAAAGGVVGVALSIWILKTLLAFLNTGHSAISAFHVTPDVDVLAFSILLTFSTAVLFGLLPSWQATRPNVLPFLKQTAGGLGGRALLRRSLVVIQIALSLVIVFGAGLLTRTLQKFATVDLGFQPDRVIALNVDPSASGHSNAEASTILDNLLNRARAFPGVKAAGLSATTPYDSTSLSMSMPVEVPGYTAKPLRGDLVVNFNFISPQYFKTLGQPLLRGRDFNGQDSEKSAPVAIVNERFDRHYFGGRDPVGKKFRLDGEGVEIVGLVADVRDQQIRSGPDETVYVPEKQGPRSKFTLLVRAAGDPRRLVPSLLGIVESVDRRMPILSVHTLDMNVAAELSPQRILAYLSTLFAALATLLAGIGLYGVLAYVIIRRTREIGIRYALGAQRANVLALFGRESMILVLVGLSIGGPLALLSASTLRSLLFGVTASDPLTLFISISVLAVAALLATFIPLWRAMGVEPMTALHWE